MICKPVAKGNLRVLISAPRKRHHFRRGNGFKTSLLIELLIDVQEHVRIEALVAARRAAHILTSLSGLSCFVFTSCMSSNTLRLLSVTCPNTVCLPSKWGLCREKVGDKGWHHRIMLVKPKRMHLRLSLAKILERFLLDFQYCLAPWIRRGQSETRTLSRGMLVV